VGFGGKRKEKVKRRNRGIAQKISREESVDNTPAPVQRGGVGKKKWVTQKDRTESRQEITHKSGRVL